MIKRSKVSSVIRIATLRLYSLMVIAILMVITAAFIPVADLHGWRRDAQLLQLPGQHLQPPAPAPKEVMGGMR
jgi:hypothetical protein